MVHPRTGRWILVPATLLALILCALPAVAAGADTGAPPPWLVVTDHPLAGAANPSALYCKLLGYGYETIATDHGEEGICILPDGRRVDAWDFFRGKVAPEYSYCARHGYRTETVDQGDGSYIAECAVCKDQQGALVGTVAELIGLDQAAGIEPQVAPESSPASPAAGPQKNSLPGRAGGERHERALPSSFDWRQQNGCTPIKDQGGCGSCWAFSTVAPLECNILIKDHRVEDLSEQWLVSCNQDGWSCGGGNYAHDYHIWKTDPCGGTGPVLERDFPYAAQDLPCSCPYPHQAQYIPDSWAYIAFNGNIPPVDSIKAAILDYGPVSIGIAAQGGFDYYGGGILGDCGHTGINHDVALVGWDDNQGSGGVWFLRNSWGTGWGEGGYCRIPYGCDLVGYEAARVDYRGLRPFTLSFADGAASVPQGNGIAYFTGTITSISTVDDVINLSTSEAGGWPVDFQVQGDPGYYQSHDVHLAAGQAIGITVRVQTDGVKRLGTGILSGRSTNTGRVLEAQLNVFNAAPAILVVADDKGSGWDAPFVQALDQLGDLYVAADPGSGPVQLGGYDAVIWETGYLVSPLSQAEMNALKVYLDGGGTLFMSSMDLLTGLTSPNSFVTNYLGVQSWTINTHAGYAVGINGDPITAGMNLKLNWPTFGANRVDTVNPRPGAAAIFNSDTGHPAAVRYDGGTFRTVFSTIAQNAMPTDNPDPNNSRTVIQNTLAWLLGTQPSAVESAQSRPPAPDLWARPNPTRGTAEIGFTLDTNAPRISLSVVDAGGRVVRSLAGGPTLAGRHQIDWNGQDDSGHPVPAGCYFARLGISTGVRTNRIIVVR